MLRSLTWQRLRGRGLARPHSSGVAITPDGKRASVSNPYRRSAPGPPA